MQKIIEKIKNKENSNHVIANLDKFEEQQVVQRNQILSEIDFKKINKAYDSEPWWYDVRGFLILTFAYQSTLPSQVRLFGNNFGKEHLEVAVGSGSLLDLILKWRALTNKPYSKITAFDYAEKMLAGALKKFSKRNDMQLLLADAAKMPFKENSFDTINIANAIHCLPNLIQSLDEMYRVLKPNGTLAGNVLLVPQGDSFWSKLASKINSWGIKKGILHKAYYQDEIIFLLEMRGFKITSSKITGNCFDFIATKI